MSKECLILVHPGSQEFGFIREYPPWGIYYTGKALERSGYAVHFLDLNGDPRPERKLLSTLVESKAQVVGFTAKWGHASRRLLRLIKSVRTTFPDVIIVLGGPLLGTITGKHPIFSMVDQFIWGDGETGMLSWIKSGKPRIDKVYGFSGRPADLNVLGLEPPNSVDLSEYVIPSEKIELGILSLHISAARGCVGKCSFCYRNSWQHGPFRTMGVQRLVTGMCYLAERYAVGGFYFIDDCLLSNWKWSEQFCHTMAAKAADLVWGCDIRASEMTRERLRMLWKGGCRSLYVGLETRSDRLRTDVIRKKVDAKTAFKKVDFAIANGFKIRVSIGIGWPSERADEMEETFNSVAKRPDLFFDIFCFTPLPNVPLGKHLPTMDPAKFSTINYDINAPNLSDASDEVRQKIWKDFNVLREQREKQMSHIPTH